MNEGKKGGRQLDQVTSRHQAAPQPLGGVVAVAAAQLEAVRWVGEKSEPQEPEVRALCPWGTPSHPLSSLSL